MITQKIFRESLTQYVPRSGIIQIGRIAENFKIISLDYHFIYKLRSSPLQSCSQNVIYHF